MSGEGGSPPIGTVASSGSSSRLVASLEAWQPGTDLRQDLVDLSRIRHRLDLRMSELAASLESSELWLDDGYTTPVQWLREEAKLPTMVACQQLAVGLQLEAAPFSVAALERGEIGFGHLALIADTAGCYREGGFDEAPFLAKARKQNLTRFRKTCDHARHAQDPRGFAADEREMHGFRYLKLSPQDGGGIHLKGWFDPEGGARLRSALEPLARPAGVGDVRSREQRLADALIEAAAGGQQTELVVSCTLETLEGRAGAPAAETEWGGLLSGEAVERLACGGASLRRLLLDGDGVVLDFGRRRRLISPQARRALEARDRHCVWPGCDRPPRWCESHHQRDWRHGGRTSVEESALLCGRHHRLRHESGWQLFHSPGGEWRAIPPPAPSWPQPDSPAG